MNFQLSLYSSDGPKVKCYNSQFLMLLLNLVMTMNQQTMKGFVGFHQQQGTKVVFNSCVFGIIKTCL